MDSRTHTDERGVQQERRFYSDRRQTWSSDELYSRLQAKREEIEVERRRGARRSSDLHPAPQDRAA